MSRTPLIAGNWKMHGTIAEAEERVASLLPRIATRRARRRRRLRAVHRAAGRRRLDARLAAWRSTRRTCTASRQGAFTGEISAPMLTEIDVHGVVLGHSERRQLFGETDKALQLKVPAALDAGLRSILCVGETEDERENGDTERRLRHQVQEGLEKVAGRAPRRGRHRLRAGLGDRHRPGRHAPSRPRTRWRSCARWSPTAPRSRPSATRILYGGSMKPDNAAELLALPDCDGGLIGGASLDVEQFVAIVEARARG